MGFFDRLFGGSGSQPQPRQPAAPSVESQPNASTDEQALQRYRYLLRTAPPEAIEQAHAEAFAQLTPEQRAQVLKELSQGLPASERAAAPTQTDPQSLARLATRAELRQPGTLERTLGGGGVGMGGMLAGSLLSSLAGAFIGTAIAHQFLGGFHGGGWGDHRDLEDARAEADTDDVDDDLDDDSGDSGDDIGGGDDMGGDFGDV